MILEIIFWLSLLSVFYAYIGYTALLWFITLFKNNPVKMDNITLSVSLVISAYNEEKNIAKKIENTLEIDYPINLLEIAIISDGSTDGTNEIIQYYAKKDNRILPCIVQTNKGKTACLNVFVPNLHGKIIIFSDANSFYDKDLIHKIIKPFADHRVGFVTGSTEYFTLSGSIMIKATSLYSKLERIIKSLESRIGSCVGADGAVFAIRKELYPPMKSYDINDLVIPLQIVGKGYRGIIEESVTCNEEIVDSDKFEFRRQTRITSRTLRALFNYRTLMNPFKYPFFAFEIISHKVMKFLSPIWIILLFITNVFLALDGPLFFTITIAIQLLFYIIAITTMLRKENKVTNRLAYICRAFVLVNVAYAFGWLKYITGETYTSWSSRR